MPLSHADLIAFIAETTEATVAQRARTLQQSHGIMARDLLALLDESPRPQQKRILQLLQQYRDPALVPALQQRIPDYDLLLAYLSVQALAAQASAGAYQALVALLATCDVAVIPYVTEALGQSGHEEAVDALLALVIGTEEPTIRYHTIEALGNLKAVRARPVIEQFADDPNHHVRERVQRALAQFETTTPTNGETP